ncbi:hypothetical protein [Actinoplanes sp. URMC 104]|uniref:hypothetical protein n=1 Tax=Actinoplanes sp. URMC 104 TaxID=3423409 RepID=UPI003F19F53A
MTATTSASRVIRSTAPCPSWCDGHTDGSPVHARDLPGVWGNPSNGPVFGLALEREDSNDGPGVPRIVLQVSLDGVLVDMATPLVSAVAEDYAVSMLRLVQVGLAEA